MDFKSLTAPTEYIRVYDELKIYIEKLQKQMMENKLKKFEQYTRDYCIYMG